MNYSALAFIFGDSCGTMEWLVIAIVTIIVFGPKNLPEIIRKAGKGMAVMRRAADEFKDQIMKMDQPETKQTDYTVSSPYPDDYDNNYPDGDIMTDIDGVPAVNANISSSSVEATPEQHLAAGEEAQQDFTCAGEPIPEPTPVLVPVPSVDAAGEGKPC